MADTPRTDVRARAERVAERAAERAAERVARDAGNGTAVRVRGRGWGRCERREFDSWEAPGLDEREDLLRLDEGTDAAGATGGFDRVAAVAAHGRHVRIADGLEADEVEVEAEAEAGRAWWIRRRRGP